MIKKKLKKTKKQRKAKVFSKLKKSYEEKEIDYKEEFKWTPKLSVDESTIDIQHQKLLNYTNKLIGSISKEYIDLAIIRDTLGFLGKYIQEHFSYEEDYMKEINYPKIEKHKRIHQGFIQFFEGYKKELNSMLQTKESLSGKLKELAEKARRFLGAWLINHIGIEDHKYAEFVKRKSGKNKIIIEKYYWKG